MVDVAHAHEKKKKNPHSSIASTRGSNNYRGGHQGMSWVLQQPDNAEEKGGAQTQTRLFKTQNPNSVNTQVVFFFYLYSYPVHIFGKPA